MLKFGMKVKDRINGFEGIVTGKAQYMTGCTQYLVEPDHVDEKGERIIGIWIDEGRLEEDVETNGGPQMYPPPIR